MTRAGIDCEIFERDKSLFDRSQGYRLHLDADAINAAREVLSPEICAVFEATSLWTEPYTTILAKDLSVVKRMLTSDEHGEGVWPAHDGSPIHANVDRATVRQCLLAGLESKIHYNKTLVRFEHNDEGVVAHFTDGTFIEGQVLVGADGIRSVVRRQRAPHCDTVDAGITAIYGRVPIDAAAPIVPKEALEDIFAIASDERKVFLGIGTVKFALAPDEAVAKFAPGISMRHQDNYVVCIVGGRHEFFQRIYELLRAPIFSVLPPKRSTRGRIGRRRSFAPAIPRHFFSSKCTRACLVSSMRRPMSRFSAMRFTR